MQVKIVKCTGEFYWYQYYIGEIVDVIIDDHDLSCYKYISKKPKEFKDDTKDLRFKIKISDTIIFDRYKKFQKLLNNINANRN